MVMVETWSTDQRKTFWKNTMDIHNIFLCFFCILIGQCILNEIRNWNKNKIQMKNKSHNIKNHQRHQSSMTFLNKPRVCHCHKLKTIIQSIQINECNSTKEIKNCRKKNSFKSYEVLEIFWNDNDLRTKCVTIESRWNRYRCQEHYNKNYLRKNVYTSLFFYRHFPSVKQSW